MSNILMYPAHRRRADAETAEVNPDLADPFLGLGWLIAAVGLLCMLSAIALTAVNLS